ncbi:MAG: hypothetical protein NC332_01760 [Firmicutes bacterium]|nr:hypothetical protein [Bacillota bacterium]
MFSEKEKSIVQILYNQIDNIYNKKIKLSWDTGYIIAEFDTCFDDFADNDENDEFTSFVFHVIRVEGTLPIIISEDNYCTINYHNFPKYITLM